MSRACGVEEEDKMDLSVLTNFINCFKSACEGDDAEAGVDVCLQRMQVTFQNIFQFTPPNFKDQIQKVCDCSYSDETRTELPEEQGGVNVCEMRHVFNCQAKDQFCLNAVDIVKEQTDSCSDLSDEALERVRERIEWGRIQKYCEVGMKNMLDNEGIGNYKCQESVDYKAGLLTSCSLQCYYKMRHISFDDNIYQDTFDYYFSFDCKQYDSDGVSDSEYDDDFWTNTVYFKGNKQVWESVSDICYQYRANDGQISEAMQASPYPRAFMDPTDVDEAFDQCCDTKEYYDALTTPYANKLEGKTESDCLKEKNMLIDYGFSMNLLRSLLRKQTGQCWENFKVKRECTLNPDDTTEQCTEPPVQMNLEDGDLMSPDNIFWFLKYFPDTRERAWALKGCARGARFGKTQTVFPGLTLSLEAQSVAQNLEEGKDVPEGYKTIYFLAFQTCGVAASMEANNYFEDGAECNANVLSPSASEDSCYAGP
jgi:hypothetical protein